MKPRKAFSEQREDSKPHCKNSVFLSAPYTAAPTACNMFCTFDVDFCAWEQATGDDFDWIRHKGPTPTPNTGPSYDHTTGGRNRKQYLAVILLEEGKETLLTANSGHVFLRLNPEPFLAVRKLVGR